MAKTLQIVAVISGDAAQFRGELSKTEGETKKSGNIMQGIFQGVGQQLTRVFVDVSKWAFRQFLDGIKFVNDELIKSLKLSAEVSEGFSEVATLGIKDLAGLREGVLDVSASMGFDLMDSIRGTYQAISAGVPEENILEFIDVTSKLAVAGLADLERTIDGTTSILNSYNMSFDEARRISDIMFTTVRLGKTRIQELSFYIGRVTPLAAQMRIEFEEVSAILASATRSGIRTRLAVTGLRSALANIITPSEQAIKVFQDMGLSVQDVNQIVAERGLIEFLQQLTPDQLKEVISSVEGLNTVLAVIGQDGGAQFSDFLGQIQDSAGATEEALQHVIGTTARQWKIMRSTIDVIRVEALEPVEKYAASVLMVLNERLLRPILDDVVPILANYLEELFTGPGAMAVLDRISDWSDLAIERLITDLDLALMGEIGFGEMIQGWIRDSWVYLEPVLVDIGAKIIKVVLKSMVFALEQGIMTLARSFERLLPEIDWGRILAMPGEAGLMGLPSFHNGGIVPDLRGGGRDVLARLQPGEQVIPRSETNNNQRYDITFQINGARDPREVAREIKRVLSSDDLLGRGFGDLAPEIA